jgi:small basic protein (TIGR04137 family)
MSIHSSLKSSDELAGERNVWTRVERLQALKKVGRWDEGDPVTGLPKVRTRFKVKSKKQLKAETPAAPGEGAAASEGDEKAAEPAKSKD